MPWAYRSDPARSPVHPRAGRLGACGIVECRPVWRNGRRDRLKLGCPRGRVGSTPTTGTPRRLCAEVLVPQRLALERVVLALGDRAGVVQRLGARDVVGRTRGGGGTVCIVLRDRGTGPVLTLGDPLAVDDHVDEPGEERDEHEQD